MAATRVRVYVGGLPADATAPELTERFSRFVAGESCQLESVELLPPKGLFALSSDAAHRGFAYLTLSGDAATSATEKLVKTYNKTKWRGSVLRVEPAKPDYLEKLELEWQEQREARERQGAAMAEAHGLAVASASRAVDDVCVGGVVFSGTKRTTFEYEDMDLDAAFAPKPKSPVPRAPPMSVPRSAADDDEQTETESHSDGSESDEDEDDEDADYWATSGDESERETVEAVPIGDVSSSSSSSSGNGGDDDASDEEYDASPADDAVAIDDVEAFVQQIMDEQDSDEQQQQQQQGSSVRHSSAAPTPALDRETANARRIAALEAKRQQKQRAKQQQLGGGVTIAIDVCASSGTKITFDDSGNEQDASDVEANDASGVNASGGRGAITNWLDSSDDEDAEADGAGARDYSELRDGSDDDDEAAEALRIRKKRNAFEFTDDGNAGGGDDADDAKAFAVRPEFLGERGKRLFELQKRFGGDQRFRMDARFIDDDENEFGGTDGLVPDDDGDAANDTAAALAAGPTGELQAFQQEVGADIAAVHAREWLAEQDTALAVIAELFPDIDVEAIKYRLRVKVKTQDPIKEASWMGQMLRYDPRDAHARHAYELPIDSSSSAKTKAKAKAGADDHDDATDGNAIATTAATSREHKDVLIGGDRFFATSSSLGSLFTRVRRNSEDGIAGEAALDGIFGTASSRGLADGDGDGNTADDGSAVPGAGAATFKLSSLFDLSLVEETEGAKAKAEAATSQLRTMGETLFEDDAADDDDGNGDATPWHFTQSFFSDTRDDAVPMATDEEDHGNGSDDSDDDDEADDDGEEEDGNGASINTQKKSKPKQQPATALKKSLAEFLAFGRAFVAPVAGATTRLATAKDWPERRRKLTLDCKRKRKDALRNKKKQQQRLQKQQHKRQRTAGATTDGR